MSTYTDAETSRFSETLRERAEARALMDRLKAAPRRLAGWIREALDALKLGALGSAAKGLLSSLWAKLSGPRAMLRSYGMAPLALGLISHRETRGLIGKGLWQAHRLVNGVRRLVRWPVAQVLNRCGDRGRKAMAKLDSLMLRADLWVVGKVVQADDYLETHHDGVVLSSIRAITQYRLVGMLSRRFLPAKVRMVLAGLGALAIAVSVVLGLLDRRKANKPAAVPAEPKMTTKFAPAQEKPGANPKVVDGEAVKPATPVKEQVFVKHATTGEAYALARVSKGGGQAVYMADDVEVTGFEPKPGDWELVDETTYLESVARQAASAVKDVPLNRAAKRWAQQMNRQRGNGRPRGGQNAK